MIDKNPGQTLVRTAFNASFLKGALAAIPIALATAASPAFSLELNFTRPSFSLSDSQMPSISNPSAVVGGAFDIQVTNLSGLTPSQIAAFAAAEATWESLIPFYKPGINIPALVIDASGVPIDGPGGILGQAGPTAGTVQGTPDLFLLATAGIMEFDTADLAALEASGALGEVILHEMAHVMGFGTLWSASAATSGTVTNAQEVYVNGTGQYTGTYGLNAWRNEFMGPGAGPGAAFVPIELGGGPGTANGHWNEVNGGAGLTGITDSLGRDMRNELMTGWLNSPTFISDTTVQSFWDIGYSTVPEPLTILGAGTAVGFGAFFKRRLAKAQKKDGQEN